ncbi:MAG: ABC transporter permease [Lachnospiraceae bacterium]|nr:ABC transporter permease [Lachnospiraceae bacterium]MDE7434865.1 ABC transporter permease [Lachnospiraceae bacterium]
MQSKTSFFSPEIFRKNIVQFWPVWLIYLLALLCIFPLRLMISTGYTYSYMNAQEIAQMHKYEYIMALFPQGQGFVSAIICLAAGLVTAMCVFAYLYQPRSSYMFHSLPLTRGELFATNYLSGLCVLWLPILVSFLTGMTICVLRGITALEFLFAWFVIMLGESLFFYSMAVLVGMFTGHIFAMLMFTLILNVLFIGCRYIVTALMGRLVYGLSQSYADRQNSILSPVIFMGNRIGVRGWGEGQYEVHGMQYIGVYCVAALVFVVVGYILYRRRRLETTGDLLCIKGTRPVFRWGLAACAAFLAAYVCCDFFDMMIASPGGMFVLALSVVIVVGGLAFFAAEMLLKKRVLVFTRKKWIECGVFIVMAASFVVAVECDVFGLEKKIPDLEDVEKASIRLYFDVEETDRSEIEEIMDIHRKIIADKTEYEQYQFGEVSNVEIDYQMKNGEMMVRTYQVPSSPAYYADQHSVVSRIYGMSVEPENYLRGNLCMNYRDVRVVTAEMEFFDDALNISWVKFNDVQTQLLYNAYLRDIREGHIVIQVMGEEQQLYINQLNLSLYCREGIQLPRLQQLQMGYDVQDWYVNLDINSRCVHTIAVLNQLGVLDDKHQILPWAEYWRRNEELYNSEEQ